jgi:hypothetical protein
VLGSCKRLALLVALAAALALLLLPASSAWAGRLIVTGHDADLHCSGGQQCGFVQVAVNWVRETAPNPALPVLVIDREDLDFVSALDAAFGAGAVPREVVDPRSPQFAATPLTTDRYSAILIASDYTCGGCDLNIPDPAGGSETPDSDAINARAGEFTSFFNAGGGIYANAGGNHGDGDAATGPDTYYSFLPVPVGGRPVSPPFCLTDIGIELGWQDQLCPDQGRHSGSRDDINCCATHNSFQEPGSASALQVAERDLGPDGTISGDDQPETLIAGGRIRGGRIVLPPPVLGRFVNVHVVRGIVRVAVPGSASTGSRARASQKGLTFVPLTQDRQIPVRSFLDTKRGTVALTSATGSGSRTQSGNFSAGIFQVLQSRSRRARGLTELRLKGASFNRCRAGGSGRSARAAQRQLSPRTIRRLRSNASGRFRTRGRHSAATVRGTLWLTADRCDGTLTKVSRGRVAVRDFRRKRTITVRAGRSYLARALR